MKKIALTTLAFAAFTVQSQAISISLSKGLNPGFTVANEAGASITVFNIFVGSFDSVITSAATWDAAKTTISTAFNEYARSSGATSGATAGFVAASVTRSEFGGANPPASDFNSKPIYVIVTDGSTPTNGSQGAILTAPNPNVTGQTNWFFPSDVTAAVGTTNAPTGTPASFSLVLGSIQDNAGTTPDVLKLMGVPIPEPTSVALFGLAGLGLIRRRRA